MNKVYLAGGMRSGWQDTVKNSVNLNFIDPRHKGNAKDKTMSLSEYGTWDLHHIKICDIVFAYMERDNPSGIGMAIEMGYAKGIGKTVVLCLEQDHKTQKDRYLVFMEKAADVVFNDFNAAILYLKSFEI